MSCLRTLFGLTLVLRTGFHMFVASYAAMDLKDLHDATSGTLKQIALKLTHISDVVKELEIPLVFYIICAGMLMILSAVYPWRDVHRSRLTVYSILHGLFVGMVIYVVYVRTIVDVPYDRDVYQYMALPWLWPASLVLDVLTYIAAVVPTGSKAPVTGSYSSFLPLHRGA